MKRSFEITVVSGDQLRLNKKPVKNAFVSLRADSHACAAKTASYKSTTTSPEWKEKLLVDLPLNVDFFTLEVQCEGSSAGQHKLVGGVDVPTSDFLGAGFGAHGNHIRFLSYRLRDAHGVRSDGVINISVKVAAVAAAEVGSVCREPLRIEMGVPVRQGRVMGGLVTGIPVDWYAQSCR